MGPHAEVSNCKRMYRTLLIENKSLQTLRGQQRSIEKSLQLLPKLDPKLNFSV